MNSYFKWPSSKPAQTTLPPKMDKYTFYSRPNPEKHVIQEKLGQNKNQTSFTESPQKNEEKKLSFSWNFNKKISIDKENNDSEVPTQNTQVKILDFQRQIALKNASINILQTENKSLNDIKNQLSQLLQKQQAQKVASLAKIQQLQNQIFELRMKQRQLQAQVKQLSNPQKQLLTALKQPQPRLNLQRLEHQPESFRQTITTFNQTISTLEKQNQLQKQQLQTMNKRLKSTQLHISQLQEQNSRLKFEKKIIIDEKHELEIYVAQLEGKNNSFCQTLKNLEEDFMNRSRIQQQLNKSFRVQKSGNDRLVETLKTNQNILKTQIASLKSRNQALLKQITELKIQIGSGMQQQFSRRSVTGLWSPKNSLDSSFRQNSYLQDTSNKLTQTIFKNHFQVQRYKQTCQILQSQLANLKSQYQRQSSSVQLLQQQLKQQHYRFQVTLRTVEQKYKFEIENLHSQIKTLEGNLNEYVVANQKKNQEIKQKENLLKRWASQKSLIK